MTRARWSARGLYLITPECADTQTLLARVEPLMAHPPALLQYRGKQGSAALRLDQAHALLGLCRRHGVPLIINDDAALAQQIGADGVHLGEDDGDLRAARGLLGRGAIIGASCYDSLPRARRAVSAGADYVAFGAFHPSPTKPAARRAGPELLRQAAALGVPRVAIGGIRPENVPDLAAAGADLIAVISGVFDAADPIAAARAYQSPFQETHA